MLIFGHRGAAGLAPENSLESVRKALALGLDGIEIDVRCSRDGVPVVIHDEHVDRTTNGRGRVQDYSLAELRQLHIGDSAQIPTLAELLGEVAGRCRLNIELKTLTTADSVISMLQNEMSANSVPASQFLVSSFKTEAVRRCRTLDCQMPLAVLFAGPPPTDVWSLTAELSACAVNIDLESTTEVFVNEAHRRGLQVMVYTVNDRKSARQLQQMGVDAIFSDFPNRVQ